MSEEAAGATPDQGSERITTSAQAVSAISRMLTSGPGDEADAQPAQMADQPQQRTEAEAPAEPARIEGDDVTQSAESDDFELPDTIEDLIKALGKDPDDVFGKLKVTRKVRGQTELVPLAQAVAQHQMHEDYARQSAILAEQRKAFDAERADATQKWQSRLSQLDTAISATASILDHGPNEADLERILADQGVEAYLKAKSQRDGLISRLNNAVQQRNHALQQSQQEQTRQTENYRRDQQEKLVNRFPELRDAKVSSSFEAELASYLGDEWGFTKDEVAGWLGGPYDHRHVLIMRDAMRYRDLQKKAPDIAKKAIAAPKMMQPKATQQVSEQERTVSALRDKLRRAQKSNNKAESRRAAVDMAKLLMR